MRVSMNIDESLLRQAERMAIESNRSLDAVLEDALRILLAHKDPSNSGGAVELPTYGGSGLQPGVDLEDKDAMAARLGSA